MSVLSGPFAFGIAAAAGLLSFLSPCVLPLVPGYLGYLSGATVGPDGELAGDRREVLLHALSFVLGFSLIFTALGASVSILGVFLMRSMPVIQKVGGIILVVLGLHTLRWINIPTLNRTFQLDPALAGERRGLLRSSIIGAIFAAGWTPCVGVVLSGILAVAATSATVGRGATLLLFYSLGLGIPFLLSALALGRARGMLRRLNQRARLVEKMSGAFLVVMGLIIFGNVLGIVSAYFYRWFGSFL